jgi:DNA replication protein DnaC
MKNSETVPTVCQDCGQEFERPVYFIGEKEFFKNRPCDRCLNDESAKIDDRKRRDSIQKNLQRFSPPHWYRQTDRDRLIVDEKIEKVMRWRPSETGRGLGLVGPHLVGKRRLLFLLGEDLASDGIEVMHISAFDFDSLGPEQFDDDRGAIARWKLRAVRSAKVLIFSDIGAEKLSESSQKELYRLVEHRAQHCLPILWSTQFNSDQIAQRFINRQAAELALTRGRAAVDRLDRISEVIQIERELFATASTPKLALPAEARSA